MRTSEAGVDFIKGWEQLALDAYYDGGGVLTIGYGHTGPDVHEGDTVTEEEAEILLTADLGEAEDAVNDFIDVELEQDEFDALVSFTFNCGADALRGSTLRRLLNNGDYHGAALQFLRWVKDNGKVVKGLVRRRTAEKALFEGAA